MREEITIAFQVFSLIYFMTEGKLFWFLSPSISMCIMFLSSHHITLRTGGKKSNGINYYGDDRATQHALKMGQC